MTKTDRKIIMLIQKFLGIILIAMGIVFIILTAKENEDIGAGLFMGLLGLAIFFTKRIVILV